MATLYLAPPESYLAAIHKIDDQVRCTLLVGHNPGLEQLLALLTGHNTLLPTAALAQIQLDVDSMARREFADARRAERSLAAK